MVTLYFAAEVFRRLANQNRGHIRVMSESCFNRMKLLTQMTELFI